MKKLVLLSLFIVPTAIVATAHTPSATADVTDKALEARLLDQLKQLQVNRKKDSLVPKKNAPHTFTDEEVEVERRRILDALPLNTCATAILRSPEESRSLNAHLNIENEEAQEARNHFWKTLKNNPKSAESVVLLQRYNLYGTHDTQLFNAALQKQFDLLQKLNALPTQKKYSLEGLKLRALVGDV